MVLDGLRREVQPPRDLGVGLAPAQAVEDLGLACGQARERGFGRGRAGRRCTEGTQQRGAAVAEHDEVQALRRGVRGAGGGDRRVALADGGMGRGEIEVHDRREQRALDRVEVAECRLERVDRRRTAIRGGCDAAVGGSREGGGHRGFGRALHRMQQTGRGFGGGDVAAREFGLDEDVQQRRTAQDVSHQLLDRPAQHCDRECGVVLLQVQQRKGCGRDELILDRRQQLRGIVGPALEQAQLGETRGRVDAMTRADRRVGAEAREEGLLRLGQPPGRAHHTAERERAVRAEHAWPASERLEDHCPHDAHPFGHAFHVARAITRRQERAERGADRELIVHLAGRDRCESLVELFEAFPHASLCDQREATVGERPHLERGIAVFDRGLQGAGGAAGEIVDVGAVAGHASQLPIAPLDARADLIEEPARAFDPAATGGGIAERTVVELPEHGGGPRRSPQIAGLAKPTEGLFELGPRLVEAIVGVREPAEELVRLGEVCLLQATLQQLDRDGHIATSSRVGCRGEELGWVAHAAIVGAADNEADTGGFHGCDGCGSARRFPERNGGSRVSHRVGRLVSVNAGLPREIAWQGRTVYTGIWKEAVTGPRTVGRLNVDGDGQGDLKGHGGEHRAVYVYQLGSYRYWQAQMHRDDFVFGQFGENFTVEGLGDDEVCIGDRYRIGSALFEVSQPRVTCYRVGIRMNEPRMAALLVEHGRPGFYLRVLEEGDVRAGADVVKVGTGPEAMTVADVNALLYLAGHHDVEQLRRALRIPALSPGWQVSLQALLDEGLDGSPGGGNAGLTAGSPPPAWRGFRTLRVAAKESESSDVVSLRLESADGQPLARARPGQFITLKLTPEQGSSPLVRSYSLSGSPLADHYRISIKVEVQGAAGNYIRTGVGVGDGLEVGAPRGSFTLDDATSPVVLVSAGVGVTPMLAMLHALHDERSTRDIWWLHGARNRAEHAFAAEAQSLLDDLAHVHRRVWYSKPAPTDHAGTDYDLVGRITPEELERTGVPLDGAFYLCGPPAFMDALRDGLAAAGVPAARVYTEIFGARDASTPGVIASPARSPHPLDGAPGSGPLISFARTGLNVRFDERFASMLEFAEACDVPVRWSCRSGVCHTCETNLLDGKVSYSPEPLEAPADGNVLICCSRPAADLVIDL